jgi:hypothetical protein
MQIGRAQPVASRPRTICMTIIMQIDYESPDAAGLVAPEEAVMTARLDFFFDLPNRYSALAGTQMGAAA